MRQLFQNPYGGFNYSFTNVSGENQSNPTELYGYNVPSKDL